MNVNYKAFLPASFDPSSRVWIYQSSRLLTISEAFTLEEMLGQFVDSWNSHGAPVKGYANLFFGQFIVLMADEKASLVSGCSTDSSVRLIKEMERRFQVNLFDRQLLAFYIKDRIQLLPLAQLKHGVESGFIHADTLYFNNTVLTKESLEKDWIVPVQHSWLANRVTFSKEIS